MSCQNFRPPTFFDPAAGQHSGIAEKLHTFFLPIFKKSRFDFRALKTPKIIFGGISIFGVIRPISVCRIEPQRFARRPVAQTSCVLFLLHTVFSTFRPFILSDFVESCRSSVCSCRMVSSEKPVFLGVLLDYCCCNMLQYSR